MLLNSWLLYALKNSPISLHLPLLLLFPHAPLSFYSCTATRSVYSFGTESGCSREAEREREREREAARLRGGGGWGWGRDWAGRGERGWDGGSERGRNGDGLRSAGQSKYLEPRH
jgi:hypothetical protein